MNHLGTGSVSINIKQPVMKTLLLSTIVLFFSLSLIASDNEKVKIKADKQTGYLPLTVKFDGTDENPKTAYSWDFGNGNTSNLKNPAAMFVNPGTYNIRLIVTNGVTSDSTFMSINVLPNPALVNNFSKARASSE
jgi:PKD repeat protein